MLSIFRVHGMTVAHQRLYNQEEIAFGLKRLLDVCDRNQRDARPILAQTYAWIGSPPKDYSDLRSKVSEIRFGKYRRFVIQAKDTISLLDALAQLIYRKLDMPVSAADIMRGISEHG